MLEIIISNKAPKPAPPVPAPWVYKPPAPSTAPPAYGAQNTSAIFLEAKRRDTIIKGLVKNLPYSVGDICQPTTDKGKQEYGKCKILHIATTYAALGKDYEWKGDNPMIVHAKGVDKNIVFFCTTDFLEKVNGPTA